jgi:hypothetical protein
MAGSRSQGYDLPQAMNQDNAFDRDHPRSVPHRPLKGTSVEHALGAILADFLLGGDQGLQFGDLHRLVRLRTTTTARLNLGENLVVTDPFQSAASSMCVLYYPPETLQ